MPKKINEQCVIICNGPSLNDIDPEFLNQNWTFGLNSIFLKKDINPTSYYVAINPLVVQQFSEQINSYKPLTGMKYIRKDKAHLIDGCVPIKSVGFPCFRDKPFGGLYEGYTVTYVAIQLAVWLGFKKILFVGLDHSYTFNGPANHQSKWEGDDVNHFDKNYFKNMQWHTPDLFHSRESYKMARKYCDNHGIFLANLSTKTMLDVFPRDDYKNWMR